MEQSNEYLNNTLADAVMNRPREFFIGKKRFCLWPQTLGMTMMLSRHISELGIDEDIIKHNPALEAMRLATEKKDEICYILSIFTYNKFRELSNSQKLKRRANYLAKRLSASELAQLLLIALNEEKAESLMEQSGITKDAEEQHNLAQYKNRDGHTLSFGGKTIYGRLIDMACRAYGWSKEYVVWGIDLLSLKMMLADTYNSVYLSDDEMKALGKKAKSTEVYGMTSEDIAKLKAMNWE